MVLLLQLAHAFLELHVLGNLCCVYVNFCAVWPLTNNKLFHYERNFGPPDVLYPSLTFHSSSLQNWVNQIFFHGKFTGWRFSALGFCGKSPDCAAPVEPTCGSELGMVPVALLTRIASSCTCSQLTPHNAPNHAGSVLELQDERNLPIFPAAPGLVGKRDVLTL